MAAVSDQKHTVGKMGGVIEAGLLIKNSGQEPEVSSVDDFIRPRQRLVDNGELTQFLESESAHLDDVLGNVAHRLSTYTKSGVSARIAFRARGVISTQFILTRQGWRMTSMAWDDERPGLTVSERYRAGFRVEVA